MAHLHILYLFMIIIVGIFSLAISINMRRKVREDFLFYYILFSAVFTFEILFSTFMVYIQENIENMNSDLFLAIRYASTVFYYFLIFSIPFFCHGLFQVPGARRKNLLFGILTAIVFIGQHYFVFITETRRVQILGEHIENSFFIFILLYSFCIGLLHISRIPQGVRKEIAKRILVLFALFIPGLLFDMFTQLGQIFSPLLYCCFSVTFSIFLLRRYPFYTGDPQSEDPRDYAAFLESYSITPREQEIAHCLLKGYRNQQIADHLNIALSTVKTHMRNIYPKLGVVSRYEFMVLFQDFISKRRVP